MKLAPATGRGGKGKPCKKLPSPNLVTLQNLVALYHRVGIYRGPKIFGALTLRPFKLWGHGGPYRHTYSLDEFQIVCKKPQNIWERWGHASLG